MIHRATERDREDWIRLNVAFFEEENEGADDPRVFPDEPEEHFSKAFDALFSQPGCELFLWEEDGHKVAFATVVSFPHAWSGGKTVLLDDLYVLPAYRRRGIGAQFMKATEAWGRQIGAKRLCLLVEPHNPSKQLYEQEGYSGIPLVYMIRYL